MNKSSDIIPRLIFGLIGVVICLSCVMAFGIPEFDGLLNHHKTEEQPVEDVQETTPVSMPDPTPIYIQAPATAVLPEPDPVTIIVQDLEPGVHPLAQELFDLTNKVRADAGLNTLTYAHDLQEAADTRAYEISVKFSHTRPDGTSCHSIVEPFDYYVTGENLMKADEPLAIPEVMMSEWMTSEGHRDNILLPEFTKLAIGICEKKGVVYAAQIFLG